MGGTLVPVVVLVIKYGNGRCLDVLGAVYANHMLRRVDGVATWAGRVVVAVVHAPLYQEGGTV